VPPNLPHPAQAAVYIPTPGFGRLRSLCGNCQVCLVARNKWTAKKVALICFISGCFESPLVLAGFTFRLIIFSLWCHYGQPANASKASGFAVYAPAHCGSWQFNFMYSLGHIPCFAKDTKHLLEGPKGSAIQSAQPAVDSRDSRPHCHSNSHVLAIWQIPLMSVALQYINLHYA